MYTLQPSQSSPPQAAPPISSAGLETAMEQPVQSGHHFSRVAVFPPQRPEDGLQLKEELSEPDAAPVTATQQLQSTQGPMIALDPATTKKKIQGLQESQFKLDITAPKPSGSYTKTMLDGGKAIKITSPLIEMTGYVELLSEYEFEEGDYARVGPVQVMTSSSRVGVYTKDGKEVARYISNIGAVRDSRPYAYADKPNEFHGAERPFYSTPEGLSNTSVSVPVNFKDQPSAPFPVEFGGGKLTRTEGEDRFNTSIGLKSGKTGQILTVKPFGWSANWNMTFDEQLNSSQKEEDKALKVWQETVGRVIDTQTYAGEIAKGKDPTLVFKTLDAAMTESAASLWLTLLASRAQDPEAVKNIEAALLAKNPTFQAQLKVIKAATRGFFGGADPDIITMFANGGKQSGDQGPFTLKEGESTTVKFSLKDILDPSAITAGSKLSIYAGGNNKDKPILGDWLELAYPFLGGGVINVSSAKKTGGSYRVDVSLV